MESTCSDHAGEFGIADLRRELGLSLNEFSKAIGITSKGRASEIERHGVCSVRVALRIEELSRGRIDAATLSADVAAARASRAAA